MPLTLYPFLSLMVDSLSLRGGSSVPSWGIGRPFVGDRASAIGGFDVPYAEQKAIEAVRSGNEAVDQEK